MSDARSMKQAALGGGGVGGSSEEQALSNIGVVVVRQTPPLLQPGKSPRTVTAI